MENIENLLTKIIRKQRSEISNILSQASIKRSLNEKILEGLDNVNAIKVVIGPRRSGKSSLVLQSLSLKKKNFAYFNFEDEELTFEYTSEELLNSLKNVYPDFEILAFDEVQLLPSWEKLVNRLQRLGINIIITGSNSKLLSSELSSSLTGRYLEYQLLPFSYHEYLEAIKEIGDNKDFEISLTSFLDYLTFGGFPSVVTNRFPKREFLLNLWDSIIHKDLVQRYKIRRIAEFKALLYLILTYMACRASNRSLSKAINSQLSHSTVAKFINWAEVAYLCCSLQNFSFKPRERVNSEKKFYLYDNGFYSANKASKQDDIGKLLENYVFIELCRFGLVPNVNLFSYKTLTGYEVDFYTTTSGAQRLIQVAYSVSNHKTLEREARALVKSAKELKIADCFIVMFEDIEQVLQFEEFKIRVVNAWELHKIFDTPP